MRPPQGRAGKHQQGTGPGKGPKGQRRDHVTTAPRTASRLADRHAAGARASGPRPHTGLRPVVAARRSPTAAAAGSSSRRAPAPLVLAPASSGIPTPDPSPLSRAAVIGVTSHADKSRHGSQTPRGLTADPAHNRPRSAGSGAARPADLPAAVAVSAPHTAAAPGTLAPLSSLTPPSPALAPGPSPIPSRLTLSVLGARPLTGLPLGREAASLPAAEAQASDAARIAAACSASATPEAAGASATRSDASHSASTTGTAATASSLALHPSLPPTVAAPVVARRARVGLIEQSTRPRGGSPRPQSTRPAGTTPAGVTKGENT
jgi:hypothetical protein